jgi:hypothetical protein
MNEGDILICKKDNILYNKNTIGKRYKVLKIMESGNNNVYVSADPISSEFQPGDICYSLTRDPDTNIPYSSMYIYDYFYEMSEIRNNKLEDLGI